MCTSGDAPAVQLRLIGELTALLHAAGIPHWLFGGWVVDLLAGEITRPHSDVDLMIRWRDAEQFRAILGRNGYSEGPSPSGPELDARFSRQEQLVEVMFLHEREDGGFFWSHWKLPPDGLGDWRGRIGEIVCPIVNPKLLLDCKEEYLSGDNETSERDKHLQDIARLRSLAEAQWSTLLIDESEGARGAEPRA